MSYDNKVSPGDREAYIKKIEKDALTLLSSTNAKIPSLFEPAGYKTLLNLFSKFHRYSYINIILIFLQQPQAAYIAGFDTWQTACLNIFGDPTRPVIRPEHQKKGIRLLAPYTQIIDKENRRLFNFVVSVYDVSQTNSLPPLEQDEDSITRPPSKKLLSALRYHSPYRITYAGRENQIIENGISGYCDHYNGLIVLDEELKNVKLLSATLREVVRAEAELLDANSEGFEDLITESVAYVFHQHFGFCLDTNDMLFVSRYQDRSIEELSAALFTVQRISHKIIETIESFLQEIEVYDADSWLDEEALLDLEIDAEY